MNTIYWQIPVKTGDLNFHLMYVHTLLSFFTPFFCYTVSIYQQNLQLYLEILNLGKMLFSILKESISIFQEIFPMVDYTTED